MAEAELRKPITGIVGCCARAASGHAAAPPRSVMNSRRIHSITSSAVASRVGGTVEAEHPGGLEVDDQLELGRLHDRQVRRLRALKDAAGVDADLTIRIRNVGPVAHQPAGFGNSHATQMSRGSMVRRQMDKLDTLAGEEGVAADERASGCSRTKVAKAASISGWCWR